MLVHSRKDIAHLKIRDSSLENSNTVNDILL